MKNLKNKSAFTMIELIFVIVILGILASVALPKLSAVKDDAHLANGNENFCVNLRTQMISHSVRNNGSLVGFDLTKHTGLIDGSTWTMSQSGDKTSLIANDLNDNNATTLKATIGNSSDNVYVYIINGKDDSYHSCLVGNSSTYSKSADEARTLIQGGSNYLQ